MLVMLVGACSSSPGGTAGPGSTTVPPAATTAGGEPTSAPAAGEPCSFLTADQVGTIVGTVPVEVKERAGRGDCDYFLNTAKDSKVNVGVTIGPDGLALFESTKGLGEPQPATLGDEAYSINLGELGTLVIARKGDTVVAIQVLTAADAADQLAKATALAQAVIAGL
jgi:hypothetical protein